LKRRRLSTDEMKVLLKELTRRKYLTIFEMVVLIKYFLKEKNIEEIAEEHGICINYVRNLRAKGVKKIREHL